MNKVQVIIDGIELMLTGKSKSSEEKRPDGGLSFYKTGGRMAFAMTYSNNLLDDDYPRQIISQGAHKTFEKEVSEGIAPPPQAWLWHEPLWKFGETTAITVLDGQDNSVSILAVGLVDKDKEYIVKQFNPPHPLAVSHGMPSEHLEIKGNVIERYRSAEISPLPRSKAANKIGTQFTVFKEIDMSNNIPPEKLKEMAEALGLSNPQALVELAQINLATVESSNRPKKEATPDSGSEPAPSSEKEAAPDYVTKAQLDGAVSEITKAVAEIAKAINASVAQLEQRQLQHEKEQVPAVSIYEQILKQAGMSGEEDEDEDEKGTKKAAGPTQAEEKDVSGYTPLNGKLLSGLRSGSRGA